MEFFLHKTAQLHAVRFVRYSSGRPTLADMGLQSPMEVKTRKKGRPEHFDRREKILQPTDFADEIARLGTEHAQDAPSPARKLTPEEEHEVKMFPGGKLRPVEEIPLNTSSSIFVHIAAFQLNFLLIFGGTLFFIFTLSDTLIRLGYRLPLMTASIAPLGKRRDPFAIAVSYIYAIAIPGGVLMVLAHIPMCRAFLRYMRAAKEAKMDLQREWSKGSKTAARSQHESGVSSLYKKRTASPFDFGVEGGANDVREKRR